MKFNTIKGKIIALGVISIFLVSITSTQAGATDIELTLSFTNLADAGDDHYEGWLIVDGSPVSTGKFNIDSAGKLTDMDGEAISSFSVSEVDLDLTTKFVLSLELKGDTDTTPHSIKPLAGDLSTDKTSATITHNVGKDFSSVAGGYILATPTDGANTTENSGIWYLDPTGSAPVAGLTLPDLTGTDWTYEGWVIIGGVPVTTGTFDKADVADDSAPFSGTEAGPPFPGEDYLVNAPTGLTFPLDLAGEVTAITIEPRVDNSADPFQFHPLAGDIPSTAVDHTLYTMSEEVSLFATGTFSITNTDVAPGFEFIPVIAGLFGLIAISVGLKRRN